MNVSLSVGKGNHSGFAEIDADLVGNWQFSYSRARGLRFGALSLNLENVRLELGSLISTILKPVMKVADQLKSLDDAMHTLDSPIPGISELAHHDVSLLSLPDDLLNGVLGAGGPIQGRALHVTDFVLQVSYFVQSSFLMALRALCTFAVQRSG